MGKKKINQGLQKVTDSKLKRLLNRKEITKADIAKLTPEEKTRFGDISSELLATLTPDQRDVFIEKIKHLLAEPTLTGMWEYNHSSILYAISSLLKENGRMPTREEISERAKVSRNTVYKHLKDYATHPLFLEQMQQFRFLSSKVLAEVAKSALAGDTGSQKLYFNVLGMLGNGQRIRTQNNYIQINGLTIDQATIQRLQPEQLAIIEGVLKSVTGEEINTLI